MRVAFANHNGLGDLVMSTAPIKRYAETNPNDEIHLFTLRRFQDTTIDLLSGLSFIKNVHPILPDAWSDSFPSYVDGLKEVLKCSREYGINHSIEKIFPMFCFRNRDEFSIYNNKMLRFAHDLNVTYVDRVQFKPIITISETSRRNVSLFLKPYKRPFTLLHLQGGNSKKTLTYNQLPFPYDFNNQLTFEIGDSITPLCKNHISVGIPNMEFTKALIEQCDRIIAIDSVVMHLAFALEKTIDALFTMTPVIQVVPLWKDYSSFVTFHCNPLELGMGLDKVRKLI